MDGVPSGYLPVCDECIGDIDQGDRLDGGFEVADTPNLGVHVNGCAECWVCTDTVMDPTLVEVIDHG